MRIRGSTLSDSGDIAIWWVGAGGRRAVVRLSSTERAELLDRLLERFPGAMRHQESLRASLGELLEPGRTVSVQARGFRHWIGLARPFQLGELASGPPILTAALRDGNVSLPLLTSDLATAAAYETACDAHASGNQPWIRFEVECSLSPPAAPARGSSRAPHTVLERSMLEAIDHERGERPRGLAHTTNAKRVRLPH